MTEPDLLLVRCFEFTQEILALSALLLSRLYGFEQLQTEEGKQACVSLVPILMKQTVFC